MTKQKDLKIRIRQHMAKTGKSFTAARADVLADNKPTADGVGSGAPPTPSDAPTTALRDERICPGCGGVLARGQDRRPAKAQDLVDDLEQLAEFLVRGTANHAWHGDAAGCEKWMVGAAEIAWRDLGILGYGVEQRRMSFFEAKLPERVAALPCTICGRTNWALPVADPQAESIADDLSQIITMLFNGVVKFARTGQAKGAENMMGQALRQLRFAFIQLGTVSQWRNDPVYLAQVKEWEWMPPFEPSSAAVHFICRDRLNLHRISDDGEYESGNWDVTAADAEKLIGGMIYLHSTKSERSYFGGKIKSVRPVVTDDARSVRFIFRFKPLPEAKEVRWKGAEHAMAWTSGVVEE